jgi:hypothetical protein
MTDRPGPRSPWAVGLDSWSQVITPRRIAGNWQSDGPDRRPDSPTAEQADQMASEALK